MQTTSTQGQPSEWDTAQPRDLIEHILSAYHVPLKAELPRLEQLARKVLEVHGESEGETLGALVSTFVALRAELEAHMGKEEQILFPMILQGQGSNAEGPIAVMGEEHVAAHEALSKLRALTNDYAVPEGACPTRTSLWEGLAAFEGAMHEHIRLEDDILFPAVLGH